MYKLKLRNGLLVVLTFMALSQRVLAEQVSPETCSESLVRIQSGKVVISKDAIKLIVSAMAAKGWALEARSVKSNPEVAKVCESLIGEAINGKQLVEKAQFRFGSWKNALTESVGAAQQAYTDWDKVDTTSILQELAREGRKMNLRSFKTTERAAVDDCLLRHGVSASAPSFADALLLRAGNRWESVLEKANLDPMLTTVSSNTSRTPDQIAELLRYLVAFYPNLLSTDFIDNSQKIRELTFAHQGASISGASLYEEMILHFGSRTAALEYAGFRTRDEQNRMCGQGDLSAANTLSVLRYLKVNHVSLAPQRFLPNYARIEELANHFFGRKVSAFTIWRSAIDSRRTWKRAVERSTGGIGSDASSNYEHSSVWSERLRLGSESSLAE